MSNLTSRIQEALDHTKDIGTQRLLRECLEAITELSEPKEVDDEASKDKWSCSDCNFLGTGDGIMSVENDEDENESFVCRNCLSNDVTRIGYMENYTPYEGDGLIERSNKKVSLSAINPGKKSIWHNYPKEKPEGKQHVICTGEGYSNVWFDRLIKGKWELWDYSVKYWCYQKDLIAQIGDVK